MGYYLKQHNSQERIIKDYLKYERLIIAVDFDSTIKAWNEFEGDNCNEICELLKELKEIGCYLILFTANKYPEKCLEYCTTLGIEIDAVNENAPEAFDYFVSNLYPEPPRKIFYNAFLDDRCGLTQTYNELKTLVNLVKDGIISKVQILV